ncbi:hypothetical protein ACROYT_G014870 [Oculina patagonica]
MELASDNKLPFVGMEILKKGHQLETSVYRKPTNTDLLLHHQSHVDKRYKKPIIKTMKKLEEEKTALKSKETRSDTRADENVSHDVVLYAFIMKFGLALVCSIAREVPSLRVFPIDVRCQVVMILCPHMSEDDGDTLFQCVTSLPASKFPHTTESDAFRIFTPV